MASPPLARRSRLIVLLGALLAGPFLLAQTWDATNLRQPTAIDATWLVHGGDDPAYARTDFDDSHWNHADSSATLKTLFPNSRPQIIWFRLHVKVPPNQTGLALEASAMSNAFEVYVNGWRILKSGQVAPFVSYTTGARLMEGIPGAEVATGSVLIALRLRILPAYWDSNYAPISDNFRLGQEGALDEHIWLKTIGVNLLGWINQFSGLGLAIVALALFAAQRRQKEYLWIFLWFLTDTLRWPLALVELFHSVPIGWEFASQFLAIVELVFITLTYWAFLRIPFGRWIQALLALAAIGDFIAWVGAYRGNFGTVATYLALLPYFFLVAVVFPILLVVHFRRGNREAGILLVPTIFYSLINYAQILAAMLALVPAFAPAVQRLYLVMYDLSAGPIVLPLWDVCNLLGLLSLALIVVLRSTRMSRQQALLEGELAAAREVQQVILPEQVDSIPGFSIESIYQPAQQVGGDFFQILPASDGGLLLVIGDVSGKGLPAAMLVSVLVGAIRTAVSYTEDPEKVLAQLNERLLGRSHGGFSTALAARISPDGSVAIANAGHLSPYLDGREIELPSALPLGIVSGPGYEAIEFRLTPGSRLTFCSDGVVEARNHARELFGFDRARTISTQPAAAIVEAARLFGQEDDITVVTIERLAAAERSTAFAAGPEFVPA